MTTPPLAPFPGQQAQAARDVNTASLCRIGQETVQDIVLRTMEIFQLLRNMQLPNGVTYHPNTHQDRLGKLQEHLRMLSVLFRKLRLVYDKCNENCAGLEPMPPEMSLVPVAFIFQSNHTRVCLEVDGDSLKRTPAGVTVMLKRGDASLFGKQLIPYVEDDSSKLDDRMANQMRASSEEKREVLEVNKAESLGRGYCNRRRVWGVAAVAGGEFGGVATVMATVSD
ncbi:Mediator of RNA polymerase II transcription subunit 30 [Anabarilius grahami]|uniref:Mediator of RNA polymerase II transcription subunit 30 n=1 Tax=Anabarilius grahami TaxID=495550 RepID=A0A3N0Z574_ANAGA|nr:Mediator of RNA polymerase II transcription subunit 30 [Anabarilius grahami]